MGPAGLTAVFGMGTGVAPPVWSPESGGQALLSLAVGLISWWSEARKARVSWASFSSRRLS
jgi:hypothetical protein